VEVSAKIVGDPTEPRPTGLSVRIWGSVTSFHVEPTPA
jgi:hypothetical protein